MEHIYGKAHTENNEILPFNIDKKTQKKWEHVQDIGAWRREYDLYRFINSNIIEDKEKKLKSLQNIYEIGKKIWM